MSGESIGYEIREREAPDGGVVLELFVEGSLFARATASSTMLDDLRTELGYERDAVIAELRKSLRGALKTQKQFVEMRASRTRQGTSLDEALGRLVARPMLSPARLGARQPVLAQR